FRKVLVWLIEQRYGSWGLLSVAGVGEISVRQFPIAYLFYRRYHYINYLVIPYLKNKQLAKRQETGMSTIDIASLLDDRPEDGVFRVHRGIYSDPDVFEMEMKYIFERNWV